MMSSTRVVIVIAALVSLLAASQALAGTSWICSVADAVACDEDGTIGPPDLGGLDQPTFFRVDADRKQVTLLAPESRRGEVTKIGTVHEGEDVWVFSGVEVERAWSLVISNDGPMTLSVTVDGATWSLFGHALRED